MNLCFFYFQCFLVIFCVKFKYSVTNNPVGGLRAWLDSVDERKGAETPDFAGQAVNDRRKEARNE